MTRERAKGLQPQVSADLNRALAQKDYQEVFVNRGKTYLLALAASQELPRLGNRVQYAQGGIGKKMAHMKRWLSSLSHSLGLVVGLSGGPGGQEVSGTPTQPAGGEGPGGLQKGSGHV